MLNPKDFAKYFHPQANFRMTDKEVVGTLHEVTPQDAFVIIQALGFEKIGQFWIRNRKSTISETAEVSNFSELPKQIRFDSGKKYRFTPIDLNEMFPGMDYFTRGKLLREAGFRPISIRRDGEVINGWGRDIGQGGAYEPKPVFEDTKFYRFSHEQLKIMYPGMSPTDRAKILRKLRFKPKGMGCWEREPLK